MCGILLEIRRSGQSINKEKLLERIRNRGPDCMQSIEITVNEETTLYFCGSVLWMQGLEPTQQPVANDQGILLFNGDIFENYWGKELSDTQFIFKKMSNTHTEEKLISEIKTLKGPFSIIYYNKLEKAIYFTRDKIGRNSLLFSKSEHSIMISSILGREYPCIEVPASHIYKLNLQTNTIKLFAWQDDLEVTEYGLDQWLENIHIQQSLPDDEFLFDLDNSLDLSDENDVIKYIEYISQSNSDHMTILEKLMKNDTILETVNEICKFLEKSVKIRVETQPNKCKNCLKSQQYSCSHCTTGILFSGGLDCTILALIADRFVPKDQPIDLINVAFNTTQNTSFDVPDRITGKQSFEELKSICKERVWVFREINVEREKLEKYQMLVIGDLIYPRRTVLDESLGSALWFAAHGNDDLDFTSCRILILGSGADELFGGYVRHRNAFKRNGWFGLYKELLLDWKRISFRNLARDNRVICDNGKQPRLPYLDEDLVNFVLKLKPWLKCFPSSQLNCGIGDKLILRLVAFHLGLRRVVTLPKRALQFGSRIANKKQRGSDLSVTFTSII